MGSTSVQMQALGIYLKHWNSSYAVRRNQPKTSELQFAGIGNFGPFRLAGYCFDVEPFAAAVFRATGLRAADLRAAGLRGAGRTAGAT